MNVFFDIETTNTAPYYSQKNPEMGKIISFGFKENGEYTILNRWDYNKDGKEDVMAFYEAFYNHWKKLVYNKKNIVGYNLLKFDIPFIMCSSQCLRMNNIRWRWDILFNTRIKDIFQKFQTDGDFIYRKLAENKKSCDSAEIPNHYKNKEYEIIVEHLKEDLDLTEEAFKKYYNDFAMEVL